MLRLLTPLIATAFVVFSSQEAVNAATCPSICSSTNVYGFTPGATSTCLCDSTGLSSCQCSQCYVRQPDGKIQTFAYGSDGTCQWNGTDCSNCELSSSSTSGSSTITSTPTTTPTSRPLSPSPSSVAPPSPSPSPVLTPSPSPSPAPTTGVPSPSPTPTPTPSNATVTATPTATPSTSAAAGSNNNSSTNSSGNTVGGNSSNSGNNSTGNNTSSDSSSSGMQTWQIALIICCAVLVFIVAMSALLSCYCKTRRRLVESEAHAEDANYYAAGVAAASGPGASTAAGIDSYGPNQRGSSAVKAGAVYGEPSSYTYASSAGSATPSPERVGPGPAYTSRPSSGSVGEATTPYSYRPSQSQAVTL